MTFPTNGQLLQEDWDRLSITMTFPTNGRLLQEDWDRLSAEEKAEIKVRSSEPSSCRLGPQPPPSRPFRPSSDQCSIS